VIILVGEKYRMGVKTRSNVIAKYPMIHKEGLSTLWYFEENELKDLCKLIILGLGDKTKNFIKNVNKLFRYVDDEIINTFTNSNIQFFTSFIRDVTNVMVDHDRFNFSSIRDHKFDYFQIEFITNIFDIIYSDLEHQTLGNVEIAILKDAIDDRVQYISVFTVASDVADIFNEMKEHSRQYAKFIDYIPKLTEIGKNIVSAARQLANADEKKSFSLSKEELEEMCNKLKQLEATNQNVVYSGMKQLNAALFPGFISGRVYVFTGCTGDGKSKLLLNLALDAKQFNKHIVSPDPLKKLTTVYISLENDNQMTLRRMISMSHAGSTSDMPSEDLAANLVAGLTNEDINEESHTECKFIYLPGGKTNTLDIEEELQQIQEDGYHITSVYLDYLKLLAPPIPTGNLKEDLNIITLELEAMAKRFNVPIITAHQMNRASASNLRAARKEERSGSDSLDITGIGNAWDIAENVDFVCGIYHETAFNEADKALYGEYMGFTVLKESRDRSKPFPGVKYKQIFAQPYEFGSGIMLKDDMGTDKVYASTYAPWHMPPGYVDNDENMGTFSSVADMKLSQDWKDKQKTKADALAQQEAEKRLKILNPLNDLEANKIKLHEENAKVDQKLAEINSSLAPVPSFITNT
jgi:replicative DNA helicase